MEQNNTITVIRREDLEKAATQAYANTRCADGIHRGPSSASIETPTGKIECMATPCQSRLKIGDWFSYRYKLNGKVISKAKLPA
jgi:hypothetical protein